MVPWVLTWILLTLCLGLLGVLLWWVQVERQALTEALKPILKKATQEQSDHWTALGADFSRLSVRLEAMETSLGMAVDDLSRSLRDYLTSVEKEKAEIAAQVGSFLPDDGVSAEIEKNYGRAEDRFIPANHPMRLSSAGSRILRDESARAASNRQARNSGRK